MSKSGKRISSLQDLADLAGVSRATVSRALNDSPLINEKTRKRLQALARKHNYTVNQQARGLRLNRSRVVSVVFMLDPRSDQHPSDPFFLEMLGGIADGLAAHDYDLLLAPAPIPSIQELAASRAVRHADGVIFVGQGEEHKALSELVDQDVNMVVWGSEIAGRRYTLIGGDNVGGGFAATQHLLELGRRRIAFFGNMRSPENSARYTGYQSAHVAIKAPCEMSLTFDIPADMQHAQTTIRAILQSQPGFDAIVCTSDVMAIAAISALSEIGIKVPSDVAVVGYDDILLAGYSTPTLTTIRQNIPYAGGVLVDSLLTLIDGKKASDRILGSELVVRKSSGA